MTMLAHTRSSVAVNRILSDLSFLATRYASCVFSWRDLKIGPASSIVSWPDLEIGPPSLRPNVSSAVE
jgi:hypothetical protein